MAKTKSEYRYQNVWQNVSEELSAEIVAFWKAESALPAGEDGSARAKQAVTVMRDADGAIAAISISGPSQLMPLETLTRMGRELARTAGSIQVGATLR